MEVAIAEDHQYAVAIEMPSEELKKTCSNVAKVSDRINISATADSVVFDGSGDRVKGATIYYPSREMDDDRVSKRHILCVEYSDENSIHCSPNISARRHRGP